MDSRGGFYSQSWDRRRHSALDAVRVAFDRLADRPVFVPPDAVPGLAEPLTSWGRFKETLLDPQLPPATGDAGWVWLIERFRSDVADAAVVCAGTAWPVLVSVASWLTARCPDAAEDIDAEVVAGFLAELPRIDLHRSRVVYRLRWTVFRHGLAYLKQELEAPVPVGLIDDPDSIALLDSLGTHDSPGQQELREQSLDPESLLAVAVAEGVISDEAAELIVATRLQGRTVTEIAAERDEQYKRLHSVRQRAERRLAAWLADRVEEMDPARTSEVEIHALSAADAPSPEPWIAPPEKKVGQRVPKSGGNSGYRSHGVAPDPRTPSSPPEEDRKCA
ncbi:sigma-70 RNA polymerase sigma factor region 4 domain-containing protein [Nocardia thraciensis]